MPQAIFPYEELAHFVPALVDGGALLPGARAVAARDQPPAQGEHGHRLADLPPARGSRRAAGASAIRFLRRAPAAGTQAADDVTAARARDSGQRVVGDRQASAACVRSGAGALGCAIPSADLLGATNSTGCLRALHVRRAATTITTPGRRAIPACGARSRAGRGAGGGRCHRMTWSL